MKLQVDILPGELCLEISLHKLTPYHRYWDTHTAITTYNSSRFLATVLEEIRRVAAESPPLTNRPHCRCFLQQVNLHFCRLVQIPIEDVDLHAMLRVQFVDQLRLFLQSGCEARFVLDGEHDDDTRG